MVLDEAPPVPVDTCTCVLEDVLPVPEVELYMLEDALPPVPEDVTEVYVEE